MDDSQLLRLYVDELRTQTQNMRLPAHDREAAGAVADLEQRLPSLNLDAAEAPRTWVFSDPHFEHNPSIAAFGRPFRNYHHGDGYLIEHWTRDVADADTIICLGDRHGRSANAQLDRPPEAQARPQAAGNGESRRSPHQAALQSLRRDRVVRPSHGRPGPALHPRTAGQRPGELRECPRPHTPEKLGRPKTHQRMRGANRVPPGTALRHHDIGAEAAPPATGAERHNRYPHRMGDVSIRSERHREVHHATACAHNALNTARTRNTDSENDT